MNTGQYDVTLVGFPYGTPNGEPPIEAMQRLFHIDRSTATRFLEAMPVTVKHNATKQVAQKYRDGLVAIGARVALRPSTPPPPPPPISPLSGEPRGLGTMGNIDEQGFPILDGVGVTPTPTPVCRADTWPPPSSIDVEEVERGFFAALPDSLALPFRGKGISWMFVALGIAIVMVIGGLIPIFGILVQLFMGMGMLTLCARFFQSSMASASADDDAPGSLPDLSSFVGDFILPGIALVLWFLSANIPLFMWLHSSWGADMATLFTNPITIVLGLAPYLIWPMALALSAVSGSFLSLWNLPKIIVGIVRAPLRYAVVLLMGFISVLIPSAMIPLLGSVSLSIFAVLAIAVGQVLVMAYSHAVMGALMGHLARVKPEVFGEASP